MEFRVEPDADEPRTFHLSGELDLACAPTLLDVVRPAAQGDGDLTLHLKELQFIDSSGIRALLLLSEELGARGKLALLSASPPVEHTLRLVGIDRAANVELGEQPGNQ